MVNSVNSSQSIMSEKGITGNPPKYSDTKGDYVVISNNDSKGYKSIYSISSKFDLSYQEIEAMNPDLTKKSSDNYTVQEGQKIYVSLKSNDKTEPKSDFSNNTVTNEVKQYIYSTSPVPADSDLFEDNFDLMAFRKGCKTALKSDKTCFGENFYEKNKERTDKIIDACYEVGTARNIDPKILFAIAMKESTCGANTNHKPGVVGTASGIMAIMPFNVSEYGYTKEGLDSDYKQNVEAAAIYIEEKLIPQLSSKYDYGSFSISDLKSVPSEGPDFNQKAILLAYRFGPGGASSKIEGNSNEIPSTDYDKVFDYIKAMK